MKHSVLVLAAMLFLVAVGCKKETQSGNGESSEKKYAVQFDVSGFDQSIGDFEGRKAGDGPLAKDSLQKHIKFLYYIIYKGYEPYKRAIQRYDDPNFGLISDSLPMGRYSLAIIGRQDSISLPSEEYYALPWRESVGFDYDDDAFYRKLAINVEGELREKVSLSRILAQVSINIKDKMPYNATTFEFEPRGYKDEFFYPQQLLSYMNLEYGSYFLGDKNGPPHYYKDVRPIPEELRNTTNNTFRYTILTLDTMTVNLEFSVKDNNGKVLGSKKLTYIPFKPNRKITLSGNLFDGLVQDSSGASIIVNPEWDGGYSVEF